MSNESLGAVILAAGKGTRMHPFSKHYPKPALPICNKPLLQYQIEMFRSIGVTDILIVIGHLGHEIAQKFGSGADLDVNIRYVEQSKLLGIAAAVGQLEPYMTSRFFLVLGDIFFSADNIQSMVGKMDRLQASAVLAVKTESDPEAIRRNFTVLFNDDESVRRVIEKPRHVTSRIKGCGLYLFDLTVFDAIRRTPRTAMRDEYEITDTVQIMVDDGLSVYADEVVTWDINLTFPPDVLDSNLYMLEKLGLENLVAESASVHPEADLRKVVVGPGAVIERPVRIRETVIFEDTRVASSHDIYRYVITPEHQIDCKNQEDFSGKT